MVSSIGIANLVFLSYAITFIALLVSSLITAAGPGAGFWQHFIQCSVVVVVSACAQDCVQCVACCGHY